MSDIHDPGLLLDLHSSRILVVDDEPSSLVLLQQFLGASGFGDVTTTDDPRTALQLFQELQPDLVILDMMMPYLDGVAVMERLGQIMPHDDHVPVLVVTADASRQARLRALSAGATDFLTKPVELAEVQLRVRNLLTTRLLHKHVSSQREGLRDRLAHQASALSTVHDAGEKIMASLDEDEIARRLLAAVSERPGFSGAVLRLADGDGHLRQRCAAGDAAAIRALRVVPGHAARQRRAVARGEVGTFFVPEPDAGTVLAGWYLPLRGHDRGLGLLEVVGTPAITQEPNAEVLTSLCGQVGAALENARLYEEVVLREGQLKDLVGGILTAQERERRQVALEIHDGLAQSAAVIHQQLQIYARGHPPRSAAGQEGMARLVDLAGRVVAEARQVIAGLRPTALDEAGLAQALREEVALMAQRGWEIEYKEALGRARLAPETETALFRVAQEALSNIRKHAGSTRVVVRLERRRGSVQLEVRDWGRGFSPELALAPSPGERVGLSSMKERIAMVGGEITICSGLGEGTRVSVTAPVHKLRHRPRVA